MTLQDEPGKIPVPSRALPVQVRWLAIGVAALSLLAMVVSTWHWPLIGDAQVMRYANFLTRHGFTPYRDITDMNTPGSYLVDRWVVDLFGSGDLAWRMYEFALIAVTTLAMIVIARPYDWLAGLLAGTVFALLHVSEGPKNAAQRDEVMTALILIALAFAFEALRRRQPWMLALSGLSLGIASGIKPTVAPLGLALLLLVWYTLRKRAQPSAAYLWSGLAGAALAAAIVLGFLIQHHALAAFIDISRRLTPYYAGLSHASTALMWRHFTPRPLLLMLPFGLAVALRGSEWKNWERAALLLAVAFGIFSYFVQGKAYLYHRYPLIALMLLWLTIEMVLAVRRPGWPRLAALSGILILTLITLPTYLILTLRVQANHEDDYALSIQSDLERLGGTRLDHRVQCFDLVDGCFMALYRAGIVQSTGSMGDLMLFTPGHAPAVEYYRQKFFDELTRNPPQVVILSSEWFDGPNRYDKVDEWPAFATYFAHNYTMIAQRDFPEQENRSYRVYLRNGETLPSLSPGSQASLHGPRLAKGR